MKKGIYAILAALAVFALVMTGCPDPGPGSTPEPYKPSTNAELLYITLAGGGEATAEIGVNTVSAITNQEIVDVSVSKSLNDVTDGAAIELGFGTTFKGEALIVIKAASATIAEDDFTGSNVHTYRTADTNDGNTTGTIAPLSKTFTAGDIIYIKLTSESGSVIKYYAFKVSIGTDASLKDKGVVFVNKYVIGSIPVVEEVPVDRIGKPLVNPTDDSTAISTLAAIDSSSDDIGKIQFNIKMPAAGFIVTALANDVDATVEISTDGTTFTEYDKDNDTLTVLVDESSIYVKVTSFNNANVYYYRILIILKRSVEIPYGTPATVNAAAPDAIWEQPGKATDWLMINRANVAEGTGLLELEPEERTYGRAKLMWDVDGIWVYAQVFELAISENPGVGSNAHMASSVELFVNESTNTTGNVTSANNGNGGQYRLGANGEISGSPDDPAVNAMKALNETSAKKWINDDFPYATTEDPIKNGYVVIFHAPWLYANDYKLANNKDLTIELQINATNPEGTRAGVLNWNNISTNSYGSLADYGDATLKLGAGQTMPPQRPTITTQPTGGGLILDPSTPVSLSVTAVSNDDGQLSYAWYKTDDAATAGTAISGATSNSLTVSEFAATAYYYVIVTNTKGGASNTRKSNVVGLIVYAAEPGLSDNWVEKVRWAGFTGGPVYGFYIGNETFGDVATGAKIVLDIKMLRTENTTPAWDSIGSRRLRVWGSYNYASWSNVTSRPDMGNASPASGGGTAAQLLIGSTDNGTTFTGTWQNAQERNLNDMANLNADVRAYKGIILLCISPAGPGGNNTGAEYYVRNIKLVKSDNTEIKPLHPASKLLWGGNGTQAFVGGNGTRTILTDPTEADDDE
jgi:hypothetical protein